MPKLEVGWNYASARRGHFLRQRGAEAGEELAQKQRDEMNANLRIANGIQAVNDYFRQGMFSNLPGLMTFGGNAVCHCRTASPRKPT